MIMSDSYNIINTLKYALFLPYFMVLILAYVPVFN